MVDINFFAFCFCIKFVILMLKVIAFYVNFFDCDFTSFNSIGRKSNRTSQLLSIYYKKIFGSFIYCWNPSK